MRTHAPLARLSSYVFYRIEIIDALAQYVGVVRIHRGSRAGITEKVKPAVIHGRPIRPRPAVL